MRTEYGYVCIAHDPPIHSEMFCYRAADLRWAYEHRTQLIDWLDLANESGAAVGYPEIADVVPGVSGLAPIVFLRQHSTCLIGIWSEKEGNLQPLAPGAHRLDPKGCGCTDCLTGWSRPATANEWAAWVRAGGA